MKYIKITNKTLTGKSGGVYASAVLVPTQVSAPSPLQRAAGEGGPAQRLYALAVQFRMFASIDKFAVAEGDEIEGMAAHIHKRSATPLELSDDAVVALIGEALKAIHPTIIYTTHTL